MRGVTTASLIQLYEKEKGRLAPMKSSIRTVLAVVLVFVMLGAILLGVTSMSDSSNSDSGSAGSTNSSSTAGSLPAVTANAGQAPTITTPTGTPPAELTTSDVIVGTGAEVLPTSTLTVHYTLMAWSTGQIIESSWDSGAPATFPLANVVEGWQKGLPGAKVGGRRLLILPPEMGYGPAGSGPIGPNETLIFAVDIIGVS
jgi:FKBP-type peptidyl-prolyl cis-trans isomerase